MKLIASIALLGVLFAPTTQAKECQTDFCHISQVARELNQQQFDVVWNNCKDFTHRAWELLEARGVTGLREVLLQSPGYPPHVALEVKGKHVISAGVEGVRIYRADMHYKQWAEVE